MNHIFFKKSLVDENGKTIGCQARKGDFKFQGWPVHAKQWMLKPGPGHSSRDLLSSHSLILRMLEMEISQSC